MSTDEQIEEAAEEVAQDVAEPDQEVQDRGAEDHEDEFPSELVLPEEEEDEQEEQEEQEHEEQEQDDDYDDYDEEEDDDEDEEEDEQEEEVASHGFATVLPGTVIPAAHPVANLPVTQSSSLYVGELLPEVSEDDLLKVFSVVGPVTSARVCRDAISRRSLGYAYVNFQIHADADRALETMNHEPILGKPCRIMWCQRDPTIRRSGVGSIFVKGLNRNIDEPSLSEAFSIFGDIISVKVQTDGNGVSTGRGFVHFDTASAAEEAMAKTSGTLLREKKITVERFKSRKERMEDPNRAPHQFKNLYYKNIGDLNEAQLQELFSVFGEITSLVIARDEDGKSKGFGFVSFAEFDSAKRAVEEMNERVMPSGLKLFAGRAMKKSERQAMNRRDYYESKKQERQSKSRGVNLFIKNLEDSITDESLPEIFKGYGEITSHKVMVDEEGKSQGFGFVSLSSQEDATRAITELNGRIVGSKPLYVALAQPEEERREQLQQQYRQRVQFQRQGGYMNPQAMFVRAPGYAFPPQMQPFYGQHMPNQQPRFAPQMGQQFPGQFPPQMNRPVRQQGFAPRPPGAGMPPRARYSNQARNTPGQQHIPVPTQQMLPPQQHLITQLANADPQRQKQILGDSLYPLVSARYPTFAGKLTGMLLQMDNSEILHLLEDPVALQQELDKANEVLRQHMGQEQ